MREQIRARSCSRATVRPANSTGGERERCLCGFVPKIGTAVELSSIRTQVYTGRLFARVCALLATALQYEASDSTGEGECETRGLFYVAFCPVNNRYHDCIAAVVFQGVYILYARVGCDRKSMHASPWGVMVNVRYLYVGGCLFFC